MADTQTTCVRRRSATLLQPRSAPEARVAITEQERALDEKIVEIGRPIALPVANSAGGCSSGLTLVMLPGLMFRHRDPFLLTADGEFVVKNIVLISAALVLIAFYRTHGGLGPTRTE